MVPNLQLSQPAVNNTELGIKRIFLKGQNAINKMQHKILFSYTNMLPCSKQINYKCSELLLKDYISASKGTSQRLHFSFQRNLLSNNQKDSILLMGHGEE